MTFVRTSIKCPYAKVLVQTVPRPLSNGPYMESLKEHLVSRTLYTGASAET